MDLSQNPTILIIEENAQHLLLLQEKFQDSFTHLIVKTATSLKEASTILPEHRWDLILLGDKLPDGDGIDFLEAISQLQPFASVAILSSDHMMNIPHTTNYHGTIEILSKDRQTLDSLVHRVTRLIPAGRRMDRLLKGEAGPNGSPIFQDPITGVYSRAYFEECLKRETSHANRHGQEFSVITIDIDRFQEVNIQQGKATGNRYLKKMASILTRSIRAGDLVARYEEDEFMLLLHQCREVDAIQCARRVINQVKKILTPCPIAVSIGIKHYQGEPKIERPEEFVRSAHQALSQAKKLGGNQYALAVG